MGQWKSLKIDSGTGWKSIYREAGTGWKALTWDSVPIDVGAACINRGQAWTPGYTIIEKSNPANASGTLTSVCLYVDEVVAGDARVGTFYLISGNTYKCRDAEGIGALATGANNKNISLTVETGDLIGFYLPNGSVDRYSSGGVGNAYKIGNKCIIDDQTVYTNAATYVVSINGTG